MMEHNSFLMLFGLAVIVVGMMARINIALLVVVSAVVTSLLGGKSLHDAVAMIGHYAKSSRDISVVWLILPLIGLLEKAGLSVAAQGLVSRLKLKTPGQVLQGYFLFRQVSAALGLTALGGQVQMVRPLVAPMVETAAERMLGSAFTAEDSQKLRASAAATDNIAAFFGEDIFLAVASILMMQAILEANHIKATPWSLSLWAVPSALLALAVAAVRYRLLDRKFQRRGV